MKNVELFSVVALHERQLPYRQAEITTCWEHICLNQFHDIIPGSSIAEVYVEAQGFF